MEVTCFFTLGHFRELYANINLDLNSKVLEMGQIL
jgi:hypothetical protein